MVKRTLFFSSPCKLTFRNCQLIVENYDTGQKRTIPIEDIGVVIIENQQVQISIPVLNALAENNSAVVFCDGKHMPQTMLCHLDSNSVQAETYKYQIEASQPLKKNLWKQIVEVKILNQSRLLCELGLDGGSLVPYYSNVRSGDSTNREGVAARLYWDTLFGGEFFRTRYGEDPNSMLNYGYSILRAAMARAIMGSGLLPAFGLFHKSRYNSFPLADDLMEPYRPYVDQVVYHLFTDGKTKLTTETKAALLRVLFNDTKFGGTTRPLEIGLSMTTASLSKCLKGEAKTLSLPEL